jgi:hypothetical protein
VAVGGLDAQPARSNWKGCAVQLWTVGTSGADIIPRRRSASVRVGPRSAAPAGRRRGSPLRVTQSPLETPRIASGGFGASSGSFLDRPDGKFRRNLPDFPVTRMTRMSSALFVSGPRSVPRHTETWSSVTRNAIGLRGGLGGSSVRASAARWTP